MRIDRLAQLLELKYHLKSAVAPSIQDVMRGIKSEILTTYKVYIDPKTAAKSYNAIPFFAQQGEVNCQQILEDMTDMVAKIDKLAAQPARLFRAVNEILGSISELDAIIKEGRESPERLDRQSQLNQYRHEVKKLEESLKRVSSMLVKQAKILQKFVPGQELAGSVVVPRRKPLSKDKLLMFMKTPVAHSFGLDRMDMMTKLLEDHQLREKLTTVINAVDRGHLPVDGPEISATVADMVKTVERKMTNTPYFEAGEDAAREFGKPNFVSPQLKKERLSEQADEELAGKQEEARLQSLIQDRDKKHLQNVEEKRQKEIDEDRKRLIRSEGMNKLLDKLLIKGIYENS